METNLSLVEWFEEKLDGHLDISRRYWNELLQEAIKIEKSNKECAYKEGFKQGYNDALEDALKNKINDCNCNYMTFGEHSISCPKFKKDCQI